MSKHLVLYRVYDDHDRLLYIGQTVQPGMRLRKHAESKEWWPAVAGITLQHFRSRDDIERAERMAILLEEPILNVQHNLVRGDPASVVNCAPYYDDGDPEDPFSEFYEPMDARDFGEAS